MRVRKRVRGKEEGWVEKKVKKDERRVGKEVG
jgi:hypothetical protein